MDGVLHAPGAPRAASNAPVAEHHAVITSRIPGPADRRLALGTLAVSAIVFLACIPFARQPLAQVWAFIPAYQAALLVSDLVTAALIFGQARIARSAALMALGAAYLFCACIAVVHALSFPGLFAPGGVIGGGAQTTAWLYMFWHAGFPLLVIAYAALKGAAPMRADPARVVGLIVLAVLAATLALTALASAGEALLPAVMSGSRYTPAMIFVVSSVWLLSAVALGVLARRTPYTMLQLWVMVVLCAWLFDVGLSAIFNAGRFDLGFYAGRLYGLAAASLVLVVLLLENTSLHARQARSLRRHDARLRTLAAIDQAIIDGQKADAIAASVIQPLRELLDVPRAIVNRFDWDAAQVEWVAAAGRRRTHVGPGVRYSTALMGNEQALRRGEPQVVDVQALAAGPEKDALLASGVRWYMAVPMIAGGELIGALSFGGDTARFDPDQVAIAQEVAAQLAIATVQTRLLEQVRRHAVELDTKVRDRTAALAASEERVRTVIEGVRDYAILTLDPKGHITSWNAGAELIKGYAAAEIIGRHFSLFYPADAVQAGWPARELELAAERGHFEDEGWRMRKDGTRFWANVVITAMRDEAGAIRGFSKITRDLSERKLAEDRVKALNKELESFSYSVSHDLRAPLRAIDGYAQMLEEDYAAKLDHDGQRMLGVVRDNARRMGQLIDDLLAFARLGRQEPALQRIDMTRLAREVADELRGTQPVAIELAELPPARADAALLRQVWANLIGNAIKYSSKKPDARVVVTAREDAEQNVYSVTDNGAGFDMRYVDKLFGVFQRLHRADEFEGTGVGLAIVQRVVTRHGGRVWAEGRLGEGASFHFSLPKAP
jgi:PAS domain S-box-containing protein